MKKLMTLVLAVCMLLTATFACAEATVLQDEKAPAIVGAVTVYDAAGQATQIDAANVTLTDISARAEGDAALAAAAKYDFASENIVAYELFSIAADGAAMIEATFELQAWQDVSVALVSVDGQKWDVAEAVVNGNTITVKAVPGIVVFAALPGAAEELPTMNETLEHGSFTPSVSAKPAPTVISSAIVDANGGVVANANGIRVEITPVASRLYTKDITVYENLTASFDEILNAQSLAALGLDEVGDLVVRDMFEVTLYGDALHGIFNLMVTFKADAPDAVAVKGADGWKLVDAANVVDNGNGTVTVTLSELGTVAFLVSVAGQNAVNSPAT